jgi:hypothetical protein
MKTIICCLFSFFLLITAADAQTDFSLDKASNSLPYLKGKAENQKYLYVTAGDKLYCIGDQAGNFPEVGFHVKGEMGGIWQHPIKLMDGYRMKITGLDKNSGMLSSAQFITYSFLNKNIYQLSNQQVSVSRTQFVPDSLPVLVVEYNFKNKGKVARSYQLSFLADVNLRPVWQGEENGMKDYPDEIYRASNNVYSFKDGGHNWFSLLSSSHNLHFSGREKTPYPGKGLTGNFRTNITIAAGKTQKVTFYISGSERSYDQAAQNLVYTKNHLTQLFLKKKSRYQVMEQTATLNVPNAKLMEAWKWGKFSSDWLVRDVPGLGRGMSAGLPDYPWFFSNDQAYTFGALTGIVKPELFYTSWSMLKRLSDKANDNSGRIIHEASTNGFVYDKGRMEESQIHIETAWQIFKWTGNLDFLKENYKYGQKSLHWLMQHDKNHNLYLEGYGGVEIKGLNEEMLDVSVQTQKLFSVLSQMAAVLHEPKAQADYQEKADTLRVRINRDWWIPSESGYADFITNKEKALEIIDTALVYRVHADRNPWASKKLKELRGKIISNQYTDKGYLVYYNTSGILPLREGIADSSKARQMLKRVGWFTNKFGLYISGIERPDDITMDEGSVLARKQEEFNYNQAVMPGATASLAIAESIYGSTDSALNYIDKTLNSFSFATPGSTYEVSPDYGMFLQAWNVTGLYIPVVQYFFGIDPFAYKKEVTIAPKMPNKWPFAELKNLLIGNTQLSVSYRKEHMRYVYQITCTEPGWKMNFQLRGVRYMVVNGLKTNGDKVVLSGKKNTIYIPIGD